MANLSSELNGMLVAMVFVVGIGGSFQYGFNLAVISSPSPYIKTFINETWLERFASPLEEQTVKLIWSLIASIYSAGGLVGALTASHLSVRWGRKACLLYNNVVAVVAAVMMGSSKAARSFEIILAARFLYGFSAGLGLSIHSMYLGESAPRRLRGAICSTIAFFNSFGKIVAQLLGLREALGSEALWPVLLAFSGIPALIQFLTLPFFPETPRYLLNDKGNMVQCIKAAKKLWGEHRYQSEIDDMVKEQATMKGQQVKTVWELCRDRSFRWQLLTVVILFITLQHSGGSAIYVYAFEVFQTIGIPDSQISYMSLGLGTMEVLGTVVCGYCIERTGRRVLLWGGYGSMSLMLGLLTVTLSLQGKYSWMSYCSIVLIFLDIFILTAGPGGATFTCLSEIFIHCGRPAAYMIAISLHWLNLFLIAILFPFMVDGLGHFCFLIMLGFCICTAFFVFLFMPETKGRNIMEITEEFNKLNFRGKAKVTKETQRGQNYCIISTKL